jgi:hypothetical protein
MKKHFPNTLTLGNETLLWATRMRGVMSLGVSEISTRPITCRYGEGNDNSQGWVVSTTASRPFHLDFLHSSGFASWTQDVSEVDFPIISSQNLNNRMYTMVIWPTGPGSSSDDDDERFFASGFMKNMNQSSPTSPATLLPTSGYGLFQVRFSRPPKATVDVYIYEADGRFVEQCKLGHEAILNLSHLEEGEYQYRVTIENGLEATGRLLLTRE